MRFLALICLFLASCNTAGPYFRGLPATEVTIDGSTFDVRVNGKLAEAIRTNAEYAPRFGPIAARAQAAMELVGGCPVREMRGDQAQALGILKCGKRPPAPALAPGGSYACYPVHILTSPADPPDYQELNCEPI
ncbi:MAG: hypothetical protein AAFU82_09795 [Pseudomonadota bacterium]